MSTEHPLRQFTVHLTNPVKRIIQMVNVDHSTNPPTMSPAPEVAELSPVDIVEAHARNISEGALELLVYRYGVSWSVRLYAPGEWRFLETSMPDDEDVRVVRDAVIEEHNTNVLREMPVSDTKH